MLLRTRKLVDASRYRRFVQGRVQQKMIDAQAGVAGRWRSPPSMVLLYSVSLPNRLTSSR
jgi:hypothetical protein